MVGARGFEPPTSRSRTVRSNQAELCPGEWTRRTAQKETRILGEPRSRVKPARPAGSFRQKRHAIPAETISGRTFIFTDDDVR